MSPVSTNALPHSFSSPSEEALTLMVGPFPETCSLGDIDAEATDTEVNISAPDVASLKVQHPALF